MTPSRHTEHSQEPTTIGSWARAIAVALEQYQVETEALFQQSGIDIIRLDDPNCRIAVADMTRLWQLCVEKTGDQAFGLQVAQQVSPTTFHALGLAALSSRNLNEVFSRFQEYMDVVSEIGEVRLEQNEPEHRLIVGVRQSEPKVADQAIDAFMASAVHVSRQYLRVDLPLIEVTLKRPAPADTSPFDNFFKTKVTFAASQNSLAIKAKDLPQTLPSFNQELAELHEQMVQNYLLQLRNPPLRNRIEQHLQALTEDGDFQLEKVAERMHTSVRNLQRQLQKADLSYQKVLDDFRRRKAIQWLTQTPMSLIEISDRLGFQNQSSFSRAFKRWTGKTPRLFRQPDS